MLSEDPRRKQSITLTALLAVASLLTDMDDPSAAMLRSDIVDASCAKANTDNARVFWKQRRDCEDASRR
jgi:hypothetical protein